MGKYFGTDGFRGEAGGLLGVRHHKEKINISKEFINKNKGAVAPYAVRINQKSF